LLLILLVPLFLLFFAIKALFLACIVALALCHEDNFAEAQFQEWMVKHSKHYATTEEYEMRLQNFHDAVHRIEMKNRLSTAATFALNKFSDLSPLEFKEKYLMMDPVNNPQGGRDVFGPKVAIKDLPTKFDWRDRKVVSPVKDQQQCGSCWAFSVVENIESVYMLTKNMTFDQMPALAPQQLVDCDDFDLGCNGGNPPFAYEYIAFNGLETNADYPYHATTGTCQYNKDDVYTTIKTWKWATSYADEKLLQQNLIGYAPLSICVDATAWQDYSSGVLKGSECCAFCWLDHCVQLVGYDTTGVTPESKGLPYWMIRNSWGSDWGMNGYILVEMGKNACGLTDEATSVVI